MHFVMTKDVGSMMESRLAQYRDERGEIDMTQWLKDANQNLAGTVTYGALAWLTEAKFGFGWIMKNAKTPTAEITLEALQALRGGKDFVSRMELDGVYEEILSDVQLRELLHKSAEDVCEIQRQKNPLRKHCRKLNRLVQNGFIN